MSMKEVWLLPSSLPALGPLQVHWWVGWWLRVPGKLWSSSRADGEAGSGVRLVSILGPTSHLLVTLGRYFPLLEP